MASWRLTVEYEGTKYRGWQEQKNARTVAGEIRVAAERLIGGRVDLLGAGRTDAGVHALAQVARLRSQKPFRTSELMVALNNNLPAEINVLKVEEARPDFDPRRDAVARYYLYQISTRRSAFAKRYVWWVRDRLDFDPMRVAGLAFVGRHDFRAFAEPRDDDRSTVVVVGDVEMAVEGDLILFRIGASHFLWKMVRRIVGSLVEVGRGNLQPELMRSLLDPRSLEAARKRFDVAAHTAPPSGLFLESVAYDGSHRLGEIAPAFAVRRL